MNRKAEADFWSTPHSECIFILPAVKESSQDCFCFWFSLFFSRPLAHGVKGVAETYLKEQVGSAFYRQPCDCKGTCDVTAKRREPGNDWGVQREEFRATADTSKHHFGTNGERIKLCVSLMSCSLVLLHRQRAETQQGARTSIRAHYTHEWVMRWQPCVCQNEKWGVLAVEWVCVCIDITGLNHFLKVLQRLNRLQKWTGRFLADSPAVPFPPVIQYQPGVDDVHRRKTLKATGTKRFPGWRLRSMAAVYLTGVSFQIATIKTTDWRQKTLNRTLTRFYHF